MAIVTSKTLTVKSPAFGPNEAIPAKYTCDGEGINPPLIIDDVPIDTKSIVLIVDDPDAPHGLFTHWVVWNIPPKTRIAENSSPGKEGKNSRQENRYHPPCPPGGNAHHYHFHVYAINTKLDLPDDSEAKSVLKAIDGHIIAYGELVGLYKKAE